MHHRDKDFLNEKSQHSWWLCEMDQVAQMIPRPADNQMTTKNLLSVPGLLLPMLFLSVLSLLRYTVLCNLLGERERLCDGCIAVPEENKERHSKKFANVVDILPNIQWINGLQTGHFRAGLEELLERRQDTSKQATLMYSFRSRNNGFGKIAA